MVLTEGWDMPEVGCCILARPTKKMGLYRQMIGRVLRPSDGKPDAIILDHSGAVFRHGFVEDPVNWTLDPDRKAETPPTSRRPAMHPGSSNARNAAPSASPAKPVALRLPASSPRRARSVSTMAISPRSAATGAPIAPSTIPPAQPMARACSSRSARSAPISPAGPRSNTRKNSATGRPGAQRPNQFRQHLKSAPGFAHA